jgi:hypothetical protein
MDLEHRRRAVDVCLDRWPQRQARAKAEKARLLQRFQIPATSWLARHPGDDPFAAFRTRRLDVAPVSALAPELPPATDLPTDQRPESVELSGL